MIEMLLALVCLGIAVNLEPNLQPAALAVREYTAKDRSLVEGSTLT